MEINMVNPNIISKKDLAQHLGIHTCTVDRYVKSGKLPMPFKLAGRGGSTCPSYFNIKDVKALAMPILPESDAAKMTERAQFHELERRIKKIASALGIDCIKCLLAEFDVEYIDALHPKHYMKFRSRLIHLNLKQLG